MYLLAQNRCVPHTRQFHVVTCAAIRDDVVWLVGHSLTRTGTEKQNIPTWTAYNSSMRSPIKQLTSISMLPLIAAPAHEWNTLLTVLKQAQKITFVVIGEGHKTVLTFDLQLYEKAVKLQLHTAPALDHLVFRLG